MKETPSTLLFLTCSMAWATSAAAYCDGGRHPSVRQEYTLSPVVATVEVTEVNSLSSPEDPEGIDKTLYTLKFLHAFKGGPTNDLVVVDYNTSSRFPMDVHQRYLVFLQHADQEWYIDSCGQSDELENSVSKVRELGRLSGK